METEFDIYNLYCSGEKSIKDNKGSYLGGIEIDLLNVGTVKIIVERKFIKVPKTLSYEKTGTLIINSNSNFESANTIAKNISSLLSFLMNTNIECINKNESLLFTPNLSYGGRRIIVKSRFGEQIRHFIESTWINYCKYNERRRLLETIRLVVQLSETNDYIEQKIALSCVVLENLKHTYGLNNDNYKHDRNKFYYPPKIEKDNLLSFKSLLENMLDDVGVSHYSESDLSTIVNIRNKILHQGLLDMPFDDMRQQYETVMSFIRVYFLALLNYKGEYRSFNAPRKVSLIE
ncbi:MAG: hypothetical protein ACSHW0_01975 [Thalassotalea sp.]